MALYEPAGKKRKRGHAAADEPADHAGDAADAAGHLSLCFNMYAPRPMPPASASHLGAPQRFTTTRWPRQ